MKKQIDLGPRASGRTIRLADAGIQTLFNTGKVVLEDHSGVPSESRALFKLVKFRLQLEHPHLIEKLDFDIKNNTVTLKQN